jgi:hypothetical protein
MTNDILGSFIIGIFLGVAISYTYHSIWIYYNERAP